MATAQGPAVSTDSGTFRLKVDYSYTTTAIKFKPFIVVTNDFKKSHSANVQWINVKGKWVDHKKTVKGTGTYYIPDKAFKTNGDYQITIKATINGKTSAVTLTSTIKPAKPKIKINYINDAHINVNITGAGAKAVPNNTVTLQRQELITASSWETVATYNPNTTGSYNYTYADQTVERGKRYRYRAQTSNTAGGSGYNTSKWIYTNPPEVSNVAHVRNNNYKCTVSWERELQYIDRSLITSYKIERSTNGGKWVTIGTKKATNNPVIETYSDKTTTVNNYYSYRIKPVNSRGTSPIAYEAEGTEPTYNTPAAPTKIRAAYNNIGDVVLTIVNPEITATDMTIERSLDGGSTWGTLETLEQTDPITSYTDDTSPSGTGIQYRIRNENNDLTGDDRYSAWKRSNIVKTLSAPNAPTITMPVDGTPVILDEAVRLSWVHNPTDGTEQERAQIQYYVNDDYISTITLEAAAYYDLTLNPLYFSANDIGKFRVRTKGAYANYSDWSEYSTFKVLTVPEITFTAPNNGDVITNLPISLSWTYNDVSGLLQVLTLDIIDPNNEVVYTQDIDTGTGESGTYTYSLAGYLFDNDTSYGLRVTALSTSGLAATDDIGIAIEYDSVRLQDSFFVDPEIDNDTGIVTLFVSLDDSPVVVDPDPDAEEPRYIDSPVDHAALYRVVNGNRVLLNSNVAAGDELTDIYAPLNVTYQYELVEVATTGEVAIVDMDVTLSSVYWYIYWGLNNEKIARARWNPNGSVNLTRPEKQQIRYSGRKYPVTYDSKAIDETYSYSGIIPEAEAAELDALRRMVQDGGQGIWKSCDGQVYKADFTVDYSADYSQDNILWDIGIAVTRIDSEAL